MNLERNESKCIICNEDMTGRRSNEHIIPRWIIKKYNLNDKYMDILSVDNSGVSITRKSDYTKNKIRICKDCNNGFLGDIENKIMNGQADEFEEFIWMGKTFLLRWCKTRDKDWIDYDSLILLSSTLRWAKKGKDVYKHWTLRKFTIPEWNKRIDPDAFFDQGNNQFGSYIIIGRVGYIFTPVMQDYNLEKIDKNLGGELWYPDFIYKFFVHTMLSKMSEYSWVSMNGMLVHMKVNNPWKGKDVLDVAEKEFKENKPKIHKLWMINQKNQSRQ